MGSVGCFGQIENIKRQSLIYMAIDDFDLNGFEKSVIGQTSYDKDVTTEFFTINEGDILEATIIAITRCEVTVNLGYRNEAIIPFSEFHYNPNIKVGDVIDVLIESASDRHGQIIASHRKARALKAWNRIKEASENNETIICFVKCRTKGGLIVDALGIEAFLPGSEIDIVRVFDFDPYIGKDLDVKVIKINEEFRNVVVSHKVIMTENLQKKSSDKTLLKDIWQKHTEVQEQILRQRTAPLSIDPSKSEVINEKLHVVLDISDNTDQLKNSIIEALDIPEEYCHFDDGYILSPISNWMKLDESVKSRISTRANKEYVSFSFYPVIDGKITDRKAQFTGVKGLLDKLEIDYDFDKNRRLQIAINELHRLKNNEEFNQLQVSLPDIASAIIPTYPSILYYLDRICPNHNFKNREVFKERSGAVGGVAIKKELLVEVGISIMKSSQNLMKSSVSECVGLNLISKSTMMP